MKNKKTVTIGIPAFNEENNIRKLLTQLLNQKTASANLVEIIVVSDASTDNTIDEVKKIKNKKVILIKNKSRQGKSATVNTIIKKATSDIVVLIDADVHLKNMYFLQTLITPIIEDRADIATAKVVEKEPKNRFEQMLFMSMAIKKEVAQIYKHGKNIYTCHGRSIAMRKRLYKKIQFPKGIIADDAYIYLYSYTKGFRYQYVKDAEVYYTLPNILEDHQKQSHRFLSTQKQLYSIFGETITKKEYDLPLGLLGKVTFRYLLKNPLMLLEYILVLGHIKLKSLVKQPATAQWEISYSSK